MHNNDDCMPNLTIGEYLRPAMAIHSAEESNRHGKRKAKALARKSDKQQARKAHKAKQTA